MTADSPARRFSEPLKPEHCVFAVGVPLTRGLFEHARMPGRYGTSREFSDHLIATARPGQARTLWSSYESLFVTPAENALHRMEERGVRVVREISFAQYLALFDAPHTGLVVLMTHCANTRQALEFSDALIPFDTMQARVPGNYSGVIDFVACRFSPAIPGLRQGCFPKAVVAYRDQGIHPEKWLAIYNQFFERLAWQPAPFQAVMDPLMGEVNALMGTPGQSGAP